MTAKEYPPQSAADHRAQMAIVLRRTAALVVKMAEVMAPLAQAAGIIDTFSADADDLAHQLDVLARPVGGAGGPGAIVEQPLTTAQVNTPQTIVVERARRVIHDPASTGTWEPPPRPLSEMVAEARRQPEDPRLPRERDE